MSTNEAQNLLRFDDADLGANRLGATHGEAAEFPCRRAQIPAIHICGGGWLYRPDILLPAHIDFGGRILPPLLAKPQSLNLESIMPFIAVGGSTLLFAVVVVGAVVVLYVARSRRKADVTVKRARGAVNYIWDTKRIRTPGSSVRSYEDVRVLIMRVGNENRFEVKEPFQNTFKAGENWTIYYTSYPFRFLSAELDSKL